MPLVWIISDVSLSVTNVLHYRRNRVYLESRESKCKYRIHLGSPDSAHPGRRGLGNWCGELLRRLSGKQAASLLGFEVRKGSRCRGRLSALARARRFLERPVSGAGPRRWRPEERAADYLQQPGLAAPPRPPAPNPPPPPHYPSSAGSRHSLAGAGAERAGQWGLLPASSGRLPSSRTVRRREAPRLGRPRAPASAALQGDRRAHGTSSAAPGRLGFPAVAAAGAAT